MQTNRRTFRRSRTVLTAIAFAAVLLTSPVASAQEQPPEPGEWYGYQTLLADVIPLTIVNIGVQDDGVLSEYVVGLGVLTSWLTGPLVHGLNDQAFACLASFALRSVTPFAAAGIVDTVRRTLRIDTELSDRAKYAVVVAPMIGVMLFDWVVLSNRPGGSTETMRQGLMLRWQF